MLSYAQAQTSAGKAVSVSSPDGKLVMSIFRENNILSYRVNYKKAVVVEPSRLGLVVNGTVAGLYGFPAAVQRYKINETFPVRGVHSQGTNKCNAAKITISESSIPFVVEVRVFNDGVAFRYTVATQGSSVTSVDTTGFVLPAGSTVWSQPNIAYYESRYAKKRVEDVKVGDLAGPPVTVVLPGGAGYLAITEAGLTDFAGMSLRADGANGFNAHLSGVARKEGDFATPWRVIEVAEGLNRLVNCDIVAAVSPPFDPALFPNGYQTSWVKPGRSVWSWLAGRGPVTLENMKRFTDLAAQLGFEYNLVDEGWSNWKDTVRHLDAWAMMKELVDYSAGKGVKIWAWKAYPDRRGIPGIKDPQQRKVFFQKCKDLGIVGLKVDFFDSEQQEIIRFYQDGLKDAAAFQLMMDFHGANKPTGESRTWPNEMSREGIRGLESRPPWATSNAVFPFTRYLAGHADFTPVHFGDRLGEVSWSQQVATLVVFTSPFLCLGADPQSILDNPARNLITSVPPDWDETLVLPQSAIGETVLYARRKGKEWFLAALNGTHEVKDLSVSLSFLPKQSFILESMSDDPAKQANAILGTATINKTTVLSIRLNAEGGYVARLTPGK